MKSVYSISLFLIVYVNCFSQQSFNMSLLGKYDYDVGVNDVWGYQDDQNNEYAIVGLVNGTSFVDVSDPTNPIEKAFFPGPTSVWRDIKTWGNYAYIVHDGISSGEAQGLLIADLSDIANGNLTYNTLIDLSFERFHNLFIDKNGIIYLFGGDADNGGCLFYDANINPTAPTFLGSYSDTYLHDGMVRGDTLWGSSIYQGSLYAIDVSDKQTPIILGTVETPSNFTHNAWVSEDGMNVFTTDEVPGAYIASIDVSDILNMDVIDTIQSWSTETNVIPHNTHVHGKLLYTSYYCDGLTVVDSSDPTNLQEIAYYDTSDSTGGTFSGAWGTYPFLPSGNILVTDRQEGLHIISLDDPEVSIAHIMAQHEVEIFPNPSGGSFLIDLKSISLKRLVISDFQGKIIEVLDSPFSEIHLGDSWLPGTYFLDIEDESGLHFSHKLIKN